ncbi:hypothetical protein B0H21DRAFT_582775 [Amylocystis lapponica]|nr:hypothetical protein B0H21DRAFT_582775 [Amylocystis lapponica]
MIATFNVLFAISTLVFVVHAAPICGIAAECGRRSIEQFLPDIAKRGCIGQGCSDTGLIEPVIARVAEQGFGTTTSDRYREIVERTPVDENFASAVFYKTRELDERNCEETTGDGTTHEVAERTPSPDELAEFNLRDAEERSCGLGCDIETDPSAKPKSAVVARQVTSYDLVQRPGPLA